MPAVPAPIEPHETLFVVGRRRFLPVHDGGRLVLYCGLKVITFDEPELFPWAEKLIAQDGFLASAATSWSAEPLPWPQVRELLDSLLVEGLLAREPAASPAPPQSAAHLAFLDAEEAREAPASPRFWNPDAGEILRQISGRDLSLGYLEAVVPVHRLAHIALDRENRHVGEINAFPNALRLKLPTEWKSCGYAGSRHRDEMPMNLTALKSMLVHWKPILGATLACREEFLRRYPQLPDGRWRLGDLHLFASAVLALPALQLMRVRGPVPNGELDPVLSSLFRVTDGVRMVAQHVLDLYDRPLLHDEPVSPRDIAAAAEREDLLVSSRGVCAGPQNMIDELLATLMDGKPVAGAPPPGSWTTDIPGAVDYSLHGRRLSSAVFTSWARMGLAYARIREVLLRTQQRGRLARLREGIERDWTFIIPTGIYHEKQRAWSERFYRDMFRRSGEGLRGLTGPAELDLSPPATVLAGPAEAALRELFASLDPPDDAEALQAIAGHLVDYLRFERSALRAITELQRPINALLGRPTPSTPLSGGQLAIYHLLRKGEPGALPYLLDLVLETLEVAVENTADATTVIFQGHKLVLQ